MKKIIESKNIKGCRNKYAMTTFFKKAVAFTLAETLIVMGIIGIVSALTLPNLNSSTGEKEKVAKVKKIYQNLTDALGRAEAVYGPVNEWLASSYDIAQAENRFKERMTDFMKISKDCGRTTTGCIPNVTYKDLSGSDAENVYSNGDQKVLLADGTAMDIRLGSLDCTDSNKEASDTDSPISKSCGYVIVDIDGTKGANTFGKDMFYFYITADGIYPFGTKYDIYGKDNNALKENCFAVGGCSGWIIENGNMDYLKVTEGKCSNGTILSWENTTCK